MTLRYLLDTSIVSAAFSRTPNRGVVSGLEAHRHACAIAAPVWHELLYGLHRMPTGKRRELLKQYFENVVALLPILPYDRVAANWHAQERARLAADGRTPPYVDGQIAAIAYANGITLVTPNVKDFAGFSGLEVEDWRS